MTRHRLKTWPCFYAEVEADLKPFEIRWNNDRDFHVGDILELHEYDHEKPLITDPMCVVHSVRRLLFTGKCSCDESLRYTGRSLERVVTSMCNFAQRDGYVVMGLGKLPVAVPDVSGQASLPDTAVYTCLTNTCMWRGARRELLQLCEYTVCPKCRCFSGFQITMP